MDDVSNGPLLSPSTVKLVKDCEMIDTSLTIDVVMGENERMIWDLEDARKFSLFQRRV